MVLSKRERMIALVTLLVVGALVLDKARPQPRLCRLQATENQKQELRAQLIEAQNLFERRGDAGAEDGRRMLSDGLRSDAEAESRVARALDDWAGDTRLTLTSVKPERVAGDKGLKEMTFVVAGKGRLDAVAQFLYKVETCRDADQGQGHAAWLGRRIRRQHVPAAHPVRPVPGGGPQVVARAVTAKAARGKQ